MFYTRCNLFCEGSVARGVYTIVRIDTINTTFVWTRIRSNPVTFSSKNPPETISYKRFRPILVIGIATLPRVWRLWFRWEKCFERSNPDPVAWRKRCDGRVKITDLQAKWNDWNVLTVHTTRFMFWFARRSTFSTILFFFLTAKRENTNISPLILEPVDFR